MRWPTLKCPFCGAVLPRRDYNANVPTVCPGCGRQLRVANWYQNLLMSLGVALTLTACYVVGLRGWRLLLATALLFFPATVFTIFMFAQIFRTPVELWPAEKKVDGPDDLFPPSITR